MDITIKVETINDVNILKQTLLGILTNLNIVSQDINAGADEAELTLWQNIQQQKQFCNSIINQLNVFS